MKSHTRLAGIWAMLVGLVFGAFVLMPSSAFAASPRPSCELTIITETGETLVRSESVMYLQNGASFWVAWKSKDATEAKTGEGDIIALSGLEKQVPLESTVYSYHFKNGSRNVECSVDVRLVAGGFDESSLTTRLAKPLIEGEVDGVKEVYLQIYSEQGTRVYTSKKIRVRNDAWSTRVTKKLSDGTYRIALVGAKTGALSLIAEGTLMVGEAPATTVTVSSIPLLSGGVVRSDTSVPIAYLQISNVGKASAKLSGFWLEQKGSASVESVMELSAIDDQGKEVGFLEGTARAHLFKNKRAFLPISLLLGVGEMRLITLRAHVVMDDTSELGKTFNISVSSVEGVAKMRGTFPINGAAWVLVR